MLSISDSQQKSDRLKLLASSHSLGEIAQMRVIVGIASQQNFYTREV